MKRLAKLLVMLLLATALFLYLLSNKGYFNAQKSTTKHVPVGQPQPRRYVLDAMTIENLVNDYREEKGLPRLIHDDNLCVIAKERAKEIKTDYSHAGFERRWGTFKYKRISENILHGSISNYAALKNWEGSPAHNAGMLDTEVDRTCVAVNGTYVVQLFIRY